MDSLPSLETIVALAKRRGFVFPTSEIYGGLVSSYDYGPLGTELLRNIRDLWWEEMISVTVDFQTLEDDTVTVRDRDTTRQVRVAVGELLPFLRERTLDS